MELSNQDRIRYSRHILLDDVGEIGQQKLKEAKVLVVGVGGLGAPILQYLAASGVGSIGIVDYDVVEESNLQRQILFGINDIGKSKVVVAKNKLLSNNPLISIAEYNFQLTNRNAIDLIEHYDIIVDGTDNFSTRYLINDACVILGKPFISGAIYKFEGQVSVFNLNDGPTYRCLYPTPPLSDEVPSCSEIGVIGVLPGIIGMLQAMEVIKLILGKGINLRGKLLMYDALNVSFTEIGIPKIFSIENTPVRNRNEFENFDYSFSCKGVIEKSNEITLEEFGNLPDETIVLDVREPWEKPIIENKKVIQAPLDDIDDYLNDIPIDTPVYVICQKGGRSKMAIEYLKKEYNLTNLINVTGGILG